jgi:hypothetical protein
MKLDMMANYSQISMDLEQNLQMLTNTAIVPSSQQHVNNYYASSQNLFDTLSSPSSTASSTASSSSSSANSTPTSKMDYHTFNNTCANSSSAYDSQSAATTPTVTSDDCSNNLYGSVKRPKASNLLPFNNMYQQPQNSSFRPQLLHSQSANNDLIQDRGVNNSASQDVS